jgi:hypothetical protein
MSIVSQDHGEPVSFTSITIISEKLAIAGGRVDITAGVSNIDIYEHLDKAYLTGAISFRDDRDIISSMDIGGGEKVEIVLQSTRDDSKPVSKTFYLDRIVASSKLGDNAEFFVLHLIEDIGYISNLKNINKRFSDNPSNIIKGISKSNLDKTVESSDIGQKTMDVIVPNMNPIEAMSWIKNMTCTSSGYPFYLTSTLVDDHLSFVDLKTVLSAPVMNQEVPYTYGQATMSAGGSPNLTAHRRVIKDYNFNGAEDLFTLIKKGLVGAEYRYLDVTAKSTAWTMFDDNAENHYKFNKFTFNAQDVVDLLEDQESPYYSDKYKVDNKSFHEFKSRSITQIGSTQAYESGSSINQSVDHANYKLNIINRSIDQLMKKNPLTLSVNGVDFLDGTSHQTVGRKIAVRFMRNTAPEDTDYYFDNKKSGDYLIFSAKHSFDRETYLVSLSCLKLSNGDVQ